MECQRTIAEVVGIVVVRINLGSGRSREASITIESNKRFCVHSIGPLLDDVQG